MHVCGAGCAVCGGGVGGMCGECVWECRCRSVGLGLGLGLGLDLGLGLNLIARCNL